MPVLNKFRRQFLIVLDDYHVFGISALGAGGVVETTGFDCFTINDEVFVMHDGVVAIDADGNTGVLHVFDGAVVAAALPFIQ